MTQDRCNCPPGLCDPEIFYHHSDICRGNKKKQALGNTTTTTKPTPKPRLSVTTSMMTADMRDFLSWLGEDPEREGLKDTPRRFLEAWKFWTSGYGQDPQKILKTFEDGSQNYSELVFQGNISLFSHCEHHLAPFYGVAHIGYIPKGRIVGLSKMPRLVEVFARRLQVQERLTVQIAEAMNEYLEPLAVGVVLRCRHSCLESRGVQKVGSTTRTSALLGAFKTDISARAEFMSFVTNAERDS